jgi:hypothetical protein
MEHNIEKVLNIKLILCIFEEFSGLMINSHKIEINTKKCLSVNQVLSFRYLGLHTHYRKYRNGERKIVEDRFEKAGMLVRKKIVT